MAKRRTQWIDTIETSRPTLAGQALAHIDIVSEADFENLGGGVTIVRIVGEMWFSGPALDDSPTVAWAIWLAAEFSGSGNPDILNNDFFQCQRVMSTGMFLQNGRDDDQYVKMDVDIRGKRKVGQGQALKLSFENFALSGQVFEYAYYLRTLLLLP